MRLSHLARRLSLSAALLLSVASLAPHPAVAQFAVGVSVAVAPPALPVYQQPPVPGPGYIWTPGYWAWNDGGYFWVPGEWVLPPAVGLLWTPGYWGWSDGAYLWSAGYWGAQIGYYGGIDYGFGYFGHGYDGGYWRNGAFFYNRSVNNIRDVRIRNVYSRTVIRNTTINRISYNGGRGGVMARPSQNERGAMAGRHVSATAFQARQFDAARARPGVPGSQPLVHRGAPGPAIGAPLARGAMPALRGPGGGNAPMAAAGVQHPRSNFAGVAGAGSNFRQPQGAVAQAPRQAYRPAPSPYARQAAPGAQSGYRPQQAYHPEQAYRAQPAYQPQQAYRAQPAYHPQQASRAQPAYHPQQAARAQPAYHPQQAYRPAAQPQPNNGRRHRD